MASRKYMSRRNKSKSKGQKRRRTLKRKYGKKRGGFLELFGLGNKKTTSTPSSISGGEEPENMSAPAPVPEQPASVEEQQPAPATEQQPAPATEQQPVPEEGQGQGEISGGKRRRRRKSSKKSRKGRKSRKSRRKQRGGCVGFAFQPSVVTPPNSALANPAPIARYTTGP